MITCSGHFGLCYKQAYWIIDNYLLAVFNTEKAHTKKRDLHNSLFLEQVDAVATLYTLIRDKPGSTLDRTACCFD
jgi:hypothetical protein